MPSMSYQPMVTMTRLVIQGHRLTNKLQHQRLVMEEFNTLRDLQEIIKQHGITRSLLAFANRSNMLSQVVKTLPATESLNAVPISRHDPRHIATLEGLDETLDSAATVTGSWVEQLASDLASIFETANDSAASAATAVQTILDDISSHTVSEGSLDTTVLTSRTADGFNTIFTVICKRLRQIGVIDVDAFFTSEEYHQANSDFVEQVVEEFKPLTGASFDADEFIHTDDDVIDEAYEPREASLTDLGYTDTTLTDVAHQAADVLQAIEDFADKQTTIITAIHEVASRFVQPIEPESASTFNLDAAHRLLCNYVKMIVMLLNDGLHHVNEFIVTAEAILEVADIRSDDGKSD